MNRNVDPHADERVNKYFRWLVRKVRVNITGEPDVSYFLLMRALFKKEFYWIYDRDENRAADGLSLRKTYKDGEVTDHLDRCNVLEMLVALASRCEKDILNDFRLGDRSNIWFWDMIQNLNLDQYYDSAFDYESVDIILNRWMDRDYDEHGHGNIFFIDRPETDIRDYEIWKQMTIYSDIVYNSEF